MVDWMMLKRRMRDDRQEIRCVYIYTAIGTQTLIYVCITVRLPPFVHQGLHSHTYGMDPTNCRVLYISFSLHDVPFLIKKRESEEAVLEDDSALCTS